MDRIINTIKTHPLTGEPIVPAGFRKPRPWEVGPQPIWPVMGGDPSNDGGDGDGNEDDGSDGANEDLGFPADTALKDMTEAQQTAYWKNAARKHEAAFRSKFGQDMTPEKVTQLRDDIEKNRQANLSAQEKAIEEAKKAGRSEALAESNERLIDTLIDARLKAAGNKKSKDFPLLDTIDRSKFITNEGDIDTDKVASVLDAVIPVDGSSGNTSGAWPFTGQGNRNNVKTSARDAGKAEAERRFKKKSGSN